MRTNLEQLGGESVDVSAAEARTMRLEQQRNERSRQRSEAAPLVFVLVLCLAGLVASCGAGEETMLQTVGDIGPDSGSLNDDGGGYSDSGESSQQQTDDPSEDLGPVELVRVPDVIGLSSDEAFSQLEAAGFSVGYGLHDVPEPGVELDTVTGADPSPGALVPFGSQIMLDVYSEGQPETSSPISPDELRRRQISQEIDAEFGDRSAWDHWDKTTGTYTIRIVDLSTDESDRLQSRYNDEAFAATIISTAINLAGLHALNASTKDLVQAFFAECGTRPSFHAVGISMVTWSVFVSFKFKEAEGQSPEECVNEMKQAVLTNAADFAKEHSILADPADLVEFRDDEISVIPGPLYLPQGVSLHKTQ